ncbi:hypothetical protein ACFS07_16030 [Undibacterium arcticum]
MFEAGITKAGRLGAWSHILGKNSYAALQCILSGEQRQFRLSMSGMGSPNSASASYFFFV